MADKGDKLYDCAIIGGGLAGLCLSIQLAKQGRSVILFEKNAYPFHKVCGEYVSNESRDFLLGLGVKLDEMNLPQIKRLRISSPRGFMLHSPLKQGGFGISRFNLDKKLYDLAKASGVVVKELCKVNGLEEKNGIRILTTACGSFYAKLVAGSYGKYSPFFMGKQQKSPKHNYVAVKYHVEAALEADVIELHNFKNGYCGISKVEDNRYCLCYLTHSGNLSANNNDIKRMEENVLFKNPQLKKYFKDSGFLFKEPLVISGITFGKKEAVKDGVFLLGDAAGTIAPLCGNGMSMAMRASQILVMLFEKYYNGDINYGKLVAEYTRKWNSQFASRINSGSFIQKLFGKEWLTHHSLKWVSRSPGLLQLLIKQTHGKPF